MFNEKPERPDKDLILTYRRKSDGGKFNGSEDERISTFLWWVEEYKPEYIDIECDVSDSDFELFAKSSTVIESYHNFWETPDYRYLKELVENSRGDYFKVATVGKNKEDVEVITRLLCNHEDVIAFLMGERFAFTRIMSALLGSPFIYCYVGKRKAPGQLELGSVRKILELLGIK
jgi:3-dehydroquinate dehydratase-1